MNQSSVSETVFKLFSQLDAVHGVAAADKGNERHHLLFGDIGVVGVCFAEENLRSLRNPHADHLC